MTGYKFQERKSFEACDSVAINLKGKIANLKLELFLSIETCHYFLNGLKRKMCRNKESLSGERYGDSPIIYGVWKLETVIPQLQKKYHKE